MSSADVLKSLILFVGGAKGGVGKSLLSMLSLHYLLEAGLKPVLIETDTANPDVFMAYKGVVQAFTVDIDTDRGFEKLLELLQGADGPVVINSGARNMATLVRYGEIFNEFERFMTFWVINHQVDSLKLLREYLKLVQKPVCVVKNGFFGEAGDFSCFDGSQLRASGMPSVFLPKAPAGFIDLLYVGRKPASALSEAGFGARLMGQRWLGLAMPVIQDALDRAAVVEV